MEPKTPIDKEAIESPALTEEEKFLEEVLQAQEEALAKERAERLAGIPPKKRTTFTTKLMIWVMAIVLTFSTFAILFEIYSIPAIEFIKKSATLSQDEAIQTYKKSIVTVSTGSSKGTGFIISEDGLIVTNEHVIDDALQYTITIPEIGVKEASLIASYPEVDLAILQVKDPTILYPSLTLATAFDGQLNEHVYFIGNPLYFTNIANEGTLIGETTTDLKTPVILLNAPVYRGNSGSPVLNEQGEVIGVIYAVTTLEDKGKVGLFIPIDALHERYP